MSEEQKPPYSTSSSFSNSVKFAATLGGIGAAGFLPVGKTGKHAWDYYVNAFRGVEEYSPGGIFRTFQLSNIFSSLVVIMSLSNILIRSIKPTSVVLVSLSFFLILLVINPHIKYIMYNKPIVATIGKP